MLIYGAGTSSPPGSQSPCANLPSRSSKSSVVGVVRNVNKLIEECGDIRTAYIQGLVRRHYLEAEFNGRRIRIQLDSGADVSLIERRLVPDTRQIF
ncbi:hypothetical protein TYRP_022079 [Tyrophagus putrescentiae]|nr:hypothetical protein TYRP_022079 [Tyrophagus putrescentiae]